MSTLFGKSAAEIPAPIRGEEELTRFFSAGEKRPEQRGIGVEFERLPVDRLTGRAVPYAAPAPGRGRPRPGPIPSVESMLQQLVDRHGWAPHLEAGRIIALERGGSLVTLEPGAQVELSGRIHRTAAAASAEIDAFVRESDAVAAELGFALLGLGCQPFSEPEEIGWVPKGRYKIMAPWLARRGHLAHTMMKATAGCQFNLDFVSQDDAMEMLRLSMAISPIVTALCANSPLARGQACGFQTRRAHVWLHTDSDRCGLLEFALRERARYSDWVSWALDVPMLFVVRDGAWVEMTGRSFRGYLSGDTRGLTPTHADWELHLTTLFPEVRLKKYIEVRGSDSASPATVAALAALWMGILYDPAARRRAWAAAGSFSWEQRLGFQRELTRRGLAARLGGVSALELAQELIEAASAGLPESERALLHPLRRLAFQDRASAACRVVELFRGPCRREPSRFVATLARESAVVG